MLEYINRKTQKREREKIFGQKALSFVLQENALAHFVAKLSAKISLFSRFYGWLQKRPSSQKKIVGFVEAFSVDTSEFEKNIEEFTSFNDFFTRKLKPQVRPIAFDPKVVAMPTDGRYLVFANIEEAEGFWVKGKKFSLKELLQDALLAEKYAQGSLAIIRLAPADYHRFHFPFDCRPSEPRLIYGALYSVNPLFLKKRISVLSENKRIITQLQSKVFGEVLMIEVGAMNVGSIHQSYTPYKPARKGQEKGYFSFGGSCILLLFEPGKVVFDADLLKASKGPIEVRAFMGESLAKSTI